MLCAMRLALCAFPLVLGARVHEAVEEHDADASGDGNADATEDGKSFLSVMTWNVEKLDGKDNKKTKYVNDIIEEVVSQHKVDVVMLQEAQSCRLVQAAMRASGMACVNSVVSPSYEADMSFTVLGGLILYSKAVFSPAAGSEDRATRLREWHQWVDVNHASMVDKHGKTLQQKWHESCTWSKLRNGRGCSSIMADIPVTNSIKLYLKQGQFSEALQVAFANGIRPVNIHLFSGGRRGLSDRVTMDKRTFQMRSLIWMNKLWNYNDRYYLEESAPTTIYAGDFNTQGRSDINQVMAPSLDYGLRWWAASDSLRTHASGEFMDHVVLGEKPNTAIVRASTEMYDQFGCSDCVNSDHNPLVVKLYASKTKAPKPSGPKIGRGKGWGPATTTKDPSSGWEFPALGEESPSTKMATTTTTTLKSDLAEDEWPPLG